MLLQHPNRLLIYCALPLALFPQDSAHAQPPQPPGAAVVQLLAIGPGAADKNRECSATGFFLNEEGYILTNAHVVEDARRCLAGAPGAKIVAKLARPTSHVAAALSCDVVAMDEQHDLALLRTERPPPREARPAFLPLRTEEVTEGTPVSVTGHPAFVWQPKTQSGRVVVRRRLRLSDASEGATDVLVLDIPLEVGASGSPVYVAEGAVIGVVARRNPARPAETFAVPVRHALHLLDRHGVAWDGHPGAGE